MRLHPSTDATATVKIITISETENISGTKDRIVINRLTFLVFYTIGYI